ncbi:MAG TPA: YtxH domain-containing protein [Pantanalinema sp.]
MNRWSATLLGALIGAGAAILLSPDSGARTRRRLRANVEALQDRTQRQWREGRMRITELVRSSQERADEIASRLDEDLSRERPQQRRADRMAPPQEPPGPERGIQ